GGGREQQVLVRQACVGAVGVIVDGDAAVEDHAPAAGADAAPQQFAAGVARDVLDPEPGVEVAAAVGQQYAVRGQRGALAFQAHVELVPGQGASQFQV